MFFILLLIFCLRETPSSDLWNQDILPQQVFLGPCEGFSDSIHVLVCMSSGESPCNDLELGKSIGRQIFHHANKRLVATIGK